jgi:hypothetical protein
MLWRKYWRSTNESWEIWRKDLFQIRVKVKESILIFKSEISFKSRSDSESYDTLTLNNI